MQQNQIAKTYAETYAVLQLPLSTIREAAKFLSRGYRPAEQFGRVHPPLGAQPTAAEWVADWTWQAMWLMQLHAELVP